MNLICRLLLLCFFPSAIATAAEIHFGTTPQRADPRPAVGRGNLGIKQNIIATGEPISIDSQGEPGFTGLDALSYDAFNCEQPLNVPYDLIGANGGDASDGGIGGVGGDGGDVEVFYSEIDDLKSIDINNSGGEGGRGGVAHRGGYPCKCSNASWKDANGVTRHCQDGKSGLSGSEGPQGSRGRSGKLSIIDPGELKLEDASTRVNYIEAYLKEIVSNPVRLGNCKFIKKTGASMLFAAQSNVPDTYDFCEKYFWTDYVFEWASTKPMDNDSNLRFRFNQNADKPNMQMIGDFFLIGSVSEEPHLKQYIITDVLSGKELTDVRFLSKNGSGRAFTVDLQDRTNIPGVADQYFVTYATLTSGRYETRCTNCETAFTEAGGQRQLLIGHLQIEAKYLEPGTQVLLTISILRTYKDQRVHVDLPRSEFKISSEY